MMFTKEQLLSLGGLVLNDSHDDLSDDKIGDYCARLTDFIDKFPPIEAELKRALYFADNESLVKTFGQLADALKSVNADKIAEECVKIAATVPTSPPDKLEADVIECVAKALTLSVDMQMEQYRGEKKMPPTTRKYTVINTDAQKTVLAVDDIPVTLNILKSAIQDAGFNFYGVTTGGAALDFCKKITPDLFILDIEMPKMNGFELANWLRKEGQVAPIIFLTGNSMREHLLKAVQAGASDFIVKPVNPVDIGEKIKKILGMTPAST